MEQEQIYMINSLDNLVSGEAIYIHTYKDELILPKYLVTKNLWDDILILTNNHTFVKYINGEKVK
jgi:hypothetical protein